MCRCLVMSCSATTKGAPLLAQGEAALQEDDDGRLYQLVQADRLAGMWIDAAGSVHAVYVDVHGGPADARGRDQSLFRSARLCTLRAHRQSLTKRLLRD